ncbi:hypothetical protein HWV62_42496 [Athelia sp. TMB]|nr:hypothetical protein HWV62_42496 [Athelia sp. TMB]
MRRVVCFTLSPRLEHYTHEAVHGPFFAIRACSGVSDTAYLISYIPSKSTAVVSTSSEAPHEGTLAPLELPTAMRVWRNRNSKFLSIVYNEEAVAMEASQTENDTLKQAALFLSPVTFDAETLHKIASIFGPLEHFAPFNPNSSDQDVEGFQTNDAKEYPTPHDAPRSAAMDNGCWKVKWGYRDDAVSALMTLRRVPHLTVTWAHITNPVPEGFISPRANVFSPSSIVSDHSPHHAFGTVNKVRDNMPSPSRSIVPPAAERINLTIQTFKDTNVISTDHDDVFSSNSAANSKGWAVKSPISPSPLGSFPHSGEALVSEGKPGLTESDFPPLAPFRGDLTLNKGFWGDRLVANNEDEAQDELMAIKPDSAESLVVASTPHVADIQIPGPERVRVQDMEEATVDDNGQDLDMPPTPDFGLSPKTPTTTNSMKFPQTPTSAKFELFASPSVKDSEVTSPSYIREPRESEIDPTTIFVGGLEINGPNNWDENRVKEYFSKFGHIEDIKFIVPNQGRSAFAFVKYDNPESSVCAVAQEHNRVHDGRAMRVQLRDLNPPRVIFSKYGRGRGRIFDSPRRASETSQKTRDGSGEMHQVAHSEYHPEHRIQPISFSPESGAEACAIKYPTLLDQPLVENLMEDPAVMENGESVTRIRTRNPSFNEYPGHQTSPNISQSKGNSPPHEQKWKPDYTSTPPTPTHSSYAASSVSASAPSAPFMSTNMGYMYPPPWMPPHFGHQIQYGLPYMAGYPGYPMPPQQPFVSYSPYPQGPCPSPSDARAPLVPTGFIQGENGALIPVYQPDALDRYMTGGADQPQPVPPVPQAPAHTHTGAPPTAWRAFPQGGAYPYIPASQMPAPPQHGGWAPNQAPYILPLASVTPTRGGNPKPGGHGGHQHSSNNRRQRQSTYEKGIGVSARGGGPVRYQHGGTEQAQAQAQADSGQGIQHAAFAAGWNQWAGTQ